MFEEMLWDGDIRINLVADLECRQCAVKVEMQTTGSLLEFARFARCARCEDRNLKKYMQISVLLDHLIDEKCTHLNIER